MTTTLPHSPAMTGRRLTLTAWLLLAIGGCTARPVAVAPPPPEVTLDAAKGIGSPLSTTSSTVAEVSPDALIGLDVTWFALQQLPPNQLTPLDALSALASAPLAQGPVLTRGRDARLVRFGYGPDVQTLVDRLVRRQDGPVEEVGHQVAWIAPGTTVRLQCTAEAPRRLIAINIFRPAVAPTTAPAPSRRRSPKRPVSPSR